MPDDDGKEMGDASRAFLTHLQESGFFQQIKDLESNLKIIAGDLTSLGTTATQRLEETESLAAHVLAVEAVLVALLKVNPVDEEEVRAGIKTSTAELSGNSEGSEAVLSIAEDILTKARA